MNTTVRESIGDAAPEAARTQRGWLDVAGGALIGGLGAGALWLGRDWPQGTLAMMESGFFPRALGMALLAIGLGYMTKGLAGTGTGLEPWAWRPLALVTAAVVAFAGVLDRWGLAAAVVVLVVVASRAGERLRLWQLAVLAGGLAGGCIALFVWGLGLPIPVWPIRVWP